MYYLVQQIPLLLLLLLQQPTAIATTTATANLPLLLMLLLLIILIYSSFYQIYHSDFTCFQDIVIISKRLLHSLSALYSCSARCMT